MCKKFFQRDVFLPMVVPLLRPGTPFCDLLDGYPSWKLTRGVLVMGEDSSRRSFFYGQFLQVLLRILWCSPVVPNPSLVLSLSRSDGRRTKELPKPLFDPAEFRSVFAFF